MSRVVCPKCGNTDVSWIRDDADYAQYICPECKQVFYYTPECDLYHDAPQTIFDCIKQSTETMARALCGNVRVGCFSGYYSMLTGMYYPDMDKAIAATIEKLNKEAKNA